MSDENFFGEATREVSSGVVDEDLLAKARVLAGGDKKSTEIEYIKLRVEQLKSGKRKRLLMTASDIARTKIASGGHGFRPYFSRFSRKFVIGTGIFCIAVFGAAILLTNEVNGACDRFRAAKENYQGWINWVGDRGIDIQDMRTAPYGYLERKYGTEAADSRRNFSGSWTEFRIAQDGLNFTEFCFAR